MMLNGCIVFMYSPCLPYKNSNILLLNFSLLAISLLPFYPFFCLIEPFISFFFCPWVAFCTATFSAPPFSASGKLKTIADGSALEGWQVGPYSPELHGGWASVVQWGLPVIHSQLLFLKAEIKAITLNNIGGHFEVKNVFRSWNVISFCERPSYSSSQHHQESFQFSSFPSWCTFIQTLSNPWHKDAQCLPLDHGILGVLLLLTVGEFKTQKAPGVQASMVQLFKTHLVHSLPFPKQGAPVSGS